MLGLITIVFENLMEHQPMILKVKEGCKVLEVDRGGRKDCGS